MAAHEVPADQVDEHELHPGCRCVPLHTHGWRGQNLRYGHLFIHHPYPEGVPNAAPGTEHGVAAAE